MFCMDSADGVPGPAATAAPTAARRGRTPSADVERELLAAAEAVLVREGPGGLTVRAVATEAGIAPDGRLQPPRQQGRPRRRAADQGVRPAPGRLRRHRRPRRDRPVL